MWVEKLANTTNTFCSGSSSLWGCELKSTNKFIYNNANRHPPCEDVSWKDLLAYTSFQVVSHPPCEDVSWKGYVIKQSNGKYVILLVRMWVEKIIFQRLFATKWVILLVRMWVEKSLPVCSLLCMSSHPPCEDVSWKSTAKNEQFAEPSHPPCEDVSWKIAMLILMIG